MFVWSNSAVMCMCMCSAHAKNVKLSVYCLYTIPVQNNIILRMLNKCTFGFPLLVSSIKILITQNPYCFLALSLLLTPSYHSPCTASWLLPICIVMYRNGNNHIKQLSVIGKGVRWEIWRKISWSWKVHITPLEFKQ